MADLAARKTAIKKASSQVQKGILVRRDRKTKSIKEKEMSTSSEPQIIETGASISLDGKIQIKKFEISSGYYFGQSGKWAIPEGWTDKEAAEFREEKTKEMQESVEQFAQQEVNELFQAKGSLNES